MRVYNLLQEEESFKKAVEMGFSLRPRQLSPKYFYDERGSELFEQICAQPEYYLTRAEIEILEGYTDQIAENLPARSTLIELGSGASLKTKLLLDKIKNIDTYVPIDISLEFLTDSCKTIASRYPDLRVKGVCADMTKSLDLPKEIVNHRASRTVFFSGSTIGNFQPDMRRKILSSIFDLSDGGFLLIGIDLHKDSKTLNAAYNDRAGVTEQFNKNLLRRMKTELGAILDEDGFRHDARYNPDLMRIETHLESLINQEIVIGENRYLFDRGERILTEFSYKFTLEGFREELSQFGFKFIKHWTDSKERFSLQLYQGGPIRRDMGQQCV